MSYPCPDKPGEYLTDTHAFVVRDDPPRGIRRWAVPFGVVDAATAMDEARRRADAWLADPHYKHPITGERIEV